MAPPVFGSAGTYLSGDDVANGAAIPIPSGMVAGQLALVFVYMQSTSAVTPTGTHAATMIELTPAPRVTGSGAHTLHVFRHVATGNESGTYTFTWTESGSDVWRGGVAIRITGADITNPVDVYTSLAQTTNVTAGPQVQVTTTGADRLIVWGGSNYNGGTWTITPAGTYTERVDTGDAVGVATRAQAAAGGTGLVRGTSSTAGRQTAWLIAIRPPAGSPPTVGAGTDATINLGEFFDRTATENANGATITDRAWTVLSGPFDVGAEIGDAAALSWQPVAAGTYVLQYAATNSAGTGTDTVNLTVVGQRMYLTDAPAAVDPGFSPAGAQGWEDTSAAEHRALSSGKAGTNVSVTGSESNTATTWDVLLRQYVSPPLVGSGVMAGPYFLTTAEDASSTAAALRRRVIMRLVSGDGQTERGFMNSGGSPAGAEWGTTPQAEGYFGDLWGSIPAPLPYEDGDRLVFEIGYRSAATTGTGTANSGTMWFGGTGGTDLEDGDTDTSRPAWIDLPPALVFAAESAPVVNAGADAAITLGATFSRAATEDNDGPPITDREWQIVSGPGAGTTIGTAAALSWEPEQGGVYVLRYFATNSGGTGVDDVTVTVDDPGDAPTVGAGPDVTLAPGDTLTRTATEDDGGSPITSRRWLLVSGPE